MEGDHLLAVGQPYHPERRTWPETVVLGYRGGWELVAFWRRPSDVELNDFRRGAIEIGVAEVEAPMAVEGGERAGAQPPLAFFLYRIGANTGDCPYDWHRIDPAEREVPDPAGPGERILLPMTLVDAETGIIRALRAVTIDPEATREMIEVVRRQATGASWPSRAFNEQAIRAVYAEMSFEDLARKGRLAPAGWMG